MMRRIGVGRPEIEAYLPHKEAMLLLDRLVEYDLELYSLRAEVDPRPGALFADADGAIPAWVGFEYMAQAVAALSGLHARLFEGVAPRIGFIMSVRNFATAVSRFEPGRPLVIEVAQTYRDGPVVSFECNISRDGAVLAKAVLNAVEPDGDLLTALEAT